MESHMLGAQMETTKIASDRQEPVTAEIGLAEAALRLKAGYHYAYRLLLTGVLQGRKSGGRWLVTVDSLDRVATTNGGQGQHPA